MIVKDARGNEFLEFIPASNEPSSRTCTDIWRMPRGVLSASGACSAPTEAERRPNAPHFCAGYSTYIDESEAELVYENITHSLVVVKIGNEYLMGWNHWRKNWD